MRTIPAFVFLLVVVFSAPLSALAEPTAAAEETQPYVILAGETEIEKLSKACDEAQGKLDEANAKADELQAHIDEIEAVLPAQEARSNAGIKQRYIMQSNPLAIVESLLAVDTLGDFIKQADYLERASRANLEEFNRLKDMRAELDKAHAEQERVCSEAQSAYDEAAQALSDVQADRAKRQAEGIAAALSQAGELGGERSVGVAYDGGKQPKDYREAATQNSEALSDGADWSASSEEFIAEWAPRIDAYLDGTPLAGQGVSFAAAAWKHGVDPRWSPAISNTESSKGTYCIRPHNAWGWGAADSDPYGLAFEWRSWEEAIDAHVAGLAKGYGYTITMNNAKRYCPNTWQSWYNKTLAQMATI